MSNTAIEQLDNIILTGQADLDAGALEALLTNYPRPPRFIPPKSELSGDSEKNAEENKKRFQELLKRLRGRFCDGGKLKAPYVERFEKVEQFLGAFSFADIVSSINAHKDLQAAYEEARKSEDGSAALDGREELASLGDEVSPIAEELFAVVEATDPLQITRYALLALIFVTKRGLGWLCSGA